MEGWSVPVPVPKDTPDGGRSTLNGSGPWVPAGNEDVVEGRVVDAVEGLAVELEAFSAAFLGNALFFTFLLAAGAPSLKFTSACLCNSALLRNPCMT